MIDVIGGGSVGLVLGARLARAGTSVRFCVRRPEDAARLREAGVTVEDPASAATWRAKVDARVGPPEGAGDLVFLCVRRPDTEAAAAALAAASPEAIPVNVQNGVDGDSALAARFPRVIGSVWRLTCTRADPGRVRTLGAGRGVVGLHPSGASPDVVRAAALLRRGGFDVGVSSQIGEDRWLKLCVNLMSAPNALVRQVEHATPAFVEGKARLLEEARAALAAAGIAARSCDGRDRSVDEEIAWQRGALARGDAARRLPLYNHVWVGLERGAPLESDAHHRAVIELACRHGIAAPTNTRVLAALERARDEKRGPECYGVEELFG
jgi:2-dehydropantoate 2-reductase